MIASHWNCDLCIVIAISMFGSYCLLPVYVIEMAKIQCVLLIKNIIKPKLSLLLWKYYILL